MAYEQAMAVQKCRHYLSEDVDSLVFWQSLALVHIVEELTTIFRGRIVDVAPEVMIIEISGQESKIEAFIEMMRPFGIIELVRTGRIAMTRGRRDDQGEDDGTPTVSAT